MNQAGDRSFHPVEGEIIDQSVLKLLGCFLLSLFALPTGVWAVWLWWSGAKWLGFSIAEWGALIGGFFAFVGLRGVSFFLLSIFRRECLILGEDCFQLATKKGRVHVQIPYRNVADIELVWFCGGEDESSGRFIGIDLHDTEDADTLNKEAGRVKKRSGWHYNLDDKLWCVSLKEIHARLKSRVQSK